MAGTPCNCILIFGELRDALETRITIFRGDLTDPRFGLNPPIMPAWWNHRVSDSLRSVSQSQIWKKLPQCEPARHA